MRCGAVYKFCKEGRKPFFFPREGATQKHEMLNSCSIKNKRMKRDIPRCCISDKWERNRKWISQDKENTQNRQSMITHVNVIVTVTMTSRPIHRPHSSMNSIISQLQYTKCYNITIPTTLHMYVFLQLYGRI